MATPTVYEKGRRCQGLVHSADWATALIHGQRGGSVIHASAFLRLTDLLLTDDRFLLGKGVGRVGYVIKTRPTMKKIRRSCPLTCLYGLSVS